MNNIIITRAILLVLFVVAVSACSTNSGKSIQYYQFETPSLEKSYGDVGRLPRVVIHPIDMPEFYQAGGIVMRVNSLQSKAAQWHLWSMSPQTMLQKHTIYKLRGELDSALTHSSDAAWLELKTSDLATYQVRFDISHFNGTENGKANIRGHWTLIESLPKTEAFVSVQHFDVTTPLESDGYTALVEALQTCWNQINQQLMDTLKSKIKINP